MRLNHSMKNILFAGILLALLMTAFSCSPGAAGWFASLLPPESIDAKYKIPKGKTIAVIVDDPNHLVNFSPVKFELARQLNKQLLENKVTKDVVSTDDVMKLTAVTPNFKMLSNTEIGKKLNADIVINVRITQFGLKDAEYSQIWHGKLQALVKVISVNKDESRLWPKDRIDGYETKVVETPRMEGTPSPQFEVKMAKAMATDMADVIAKYFYKHPGRAHDDLPDKVMDETP